MNASAADSEAEGKPPSDSGGGGGGRLRWQIACAILLVLVALGIAVWWFVAGRYRESTEDAYVDGNVVSVTAQVSGVITAINADNTDYVTAGNSLVKLDDTDAKLALSRAEAQLAKTVRQVRTQYAAVKQARANQQLREIELARVKADLAHRKELVGSGAISGEEARHAENTVRAAVAALDAANHQLAASTAQVDHTTIATHPDVLAAASQVRDAYVAAYRTEVPAPVTGVVTKRSAQVGQKISPGISLMSVVPLDHLWVNANFKESQLRHIRIGQPVRLYADVYGDDVVYQGTVIGQDAGTGSAFSLLPAQNATGNWIKIVQRVPVRIALDPQQVAKHPLQLGLSMKVVMDTQQRDGTRLVVPGSRAHGYQTDVFASELARADDVVQKIIQANQ
ncbi:efflux RND transporter periplasmic adaptor subunit [Cupriavidus sp. CV2]|uniref:HlyD family secretion protein n=1 Tax=Cupriavidus ulmosensis TaxID=3065913 RepID=UPI00296B3DD8|nr:efflux RND transporter periplasmic adaptor subunit [Cupriavidus sp. CV2]MDW3685503.1 efflux RND transporter periplasmic adaptor subunit [Cupriavidus sp. CV2]